MLAIAYAQEMPAAYKDMLTTLGRSGDFKDNVLKVNIPSNDLHVTVPQRNRQPVSTPRSPRRSPVIKVNRTADGVFR